MGAYVKLLEYDDIDGMILLSELSRRRIRSIQKLIRIGRNEVVIVLRVDKEKGEVFFFFYCFCLLDLEMVAVRLAHNSYRVYRFIEATSFSRGRRQM